MQLSTKSEDQIALDPNSPVLSIEHCRSCRVFRRRAEELHATLQTRLQNAGQQFQQLQLQLNAQGAPRRGAFELSFAPNPTTDTTGQHLIWSGWKRTPRAQKFPDADEMCEQIIKLYNEHSKPSEPENTKKLNRSSRTPSPTPNPIAATSDKEKQTKPKRSSRTPSLTQEAIASSSSDPEKQTKPKRSSRTPSSTSDQIAVTSSEAEKKTTKRKRTSLIPPSPTSEMPSTSRASKRRKASAKPTT